MKQRQNISARPGGLMRQEEDGGKQLLHRNVHFRPSGDTRPSTDDYAWRSPVRTVRSELRGTATHTDSGTAKARPHKFRR